MAKKKPVSIVERAVAKTKITIEERDAKYLEKYDYYTFWGGRGRKIIRRNTARLDNNGRGYTTLAEDIIGRPAIIGYRDGNSCNLARENIIIRRFLGHTHTDQFARLAKKDIERSRRELSYPKKIYSAVVGVTYRKDRKKKPWRVRIGVNGKVYYLGHYATREEAEAVAIKAGSGDLCV